MLARVVVENGVKKIVPLTADCGSGNPVGTVIAVYSNKVPNGYLPCNGVAFDTAQFPVLYALLQDDHTPDLRECTLVGIGQSDRTMGAHDVYTVGEFKDDQLQNLAGKINISTKNGSATGVFEDTNSFTYADGLSASGTQWSGLDFNASKMARTGTTTHGKQVGVNWCIKATSGINENQADNVLSALSPVNAVTSGDMHAVTSNAVAGYKTSSVTSGSDVPVTSGAMYNKIYGVRLTTEDLNNITDSGMYYMNNATCTNAPSSAYENGTLNGILFVNQYGADTPYPNTYTQTIKVFMSGVPYIATRRKWNGGSWGDWYQETTIRYKVITTTTNSSGEVPSATIDLDYAKNMIIGVNCSWDGTGLSIYRDYKVVCNLGNRKYYLVVYDGNGTPIRSQSVAVRIAYIEI